MGITMRMTLAKNMIVGFENMGILHHVMIEKVEKVHFVMLDLME